MCFARAWMYLPGGANEDKIIPSMMECISEYEDKRTKKW